MWDLKLLFINFFFFFNFEIENFFFSFFNFLDPLMQNGFFIINWTSSSYFPQNISFFFGIKFCLSIAFLILIRGGTPRYRYDYLTKLGWLKFLSFVILTFIFSLLFFYIF